MRGIASERPRKRRTSVVLQHRSKDARRVEWAATRKKDAGRTTGCKINKRSQARSGKNKTTPEIPQVFADPDPYSLLFFLQMHGVKPTTPIQSHFDLSGKRMSASSLAQPADTRVDDTPEVDVSNTAPSAHSHDFQTDPRDTHSARVVPVHCFHPAR
jgi:hypothetical protein